MIIILIGFLIWVPLHQNEYHSVFSSEKFALAMLMGAREVEASSLLPAGLCSKKAKPVAPKREEGRGEERELWPRGTQVET